MTAPSRGVKSMGASQVLLQVYYNYYSMKLVNNKKKSVVSSTNSLDIQCGKPFFPQLAILASGILVLLAK